MGESVFAAADSCVPEGGSLLTASDSMCGNLVIKCNNHQETWTKPGCGCGCVDVKNDDSGDSVEDSGSSDSEDTDDNEAASGMAEEVATLYNEPQFHENGLDEKPVKTHVDPRMMQSILW